MRVQPAVHPRIEAAEVGHDAGSPQSSCWKIDIEAPFRCTRRVAENVQLRLLDKCRSRAGPVARAKLAARRSERPMEKDRNQNGSTPAITFNRLVLRLFDLGYQVRGMLLMLREEREAGFQ